MIIIIIMMMMMMIIIIRGAPRAREARAWTEPHS